MEMPTEFRIIEKETLSGNKKYFPQALNLSETTEKGFLFWKKSETKNYWKCFTHNSKDKDFTLTSHAFDDFRDALFYDIIRLAEMSILKFKTDYQIIVDYNNNLYFKNEFKIIRHKII